MILKRFVGRVGRWVKFGGNGGEGCFRGVVGLLRDWFELPDSVEWIEIELHNRPSENRWAFDVKDPAGFPEMVCAEKLGGCIESAKIDRVLEPLIGKRVYLGVNYR